MHGSSGNLIRTLSKSVTACTFGWLAHLALIYFALYSDTDDTPLRRATELPHGLGTGEWTLRLKGWPRHCRVTISPALKTLWRSPQIISVMTGGMRLLRG